MLHLYPNQNNIASRHNRNFQRSSNVGQTEMNNESLPEDNQSSDKSEDRVQAHFVQNEGTTILPTALINIEMSGELFTVRALLDAGSRYQLINTKHKSPVWVVQ